ncbi:MAG TPA: hypothetical protein VKE74_27275 [Gemmataceae bacterium]|nr:hypothetical protein [Gemmataceae bacterium]
MRQIRSAPIRWTATAALAVALALAAGCGGGEGTVRGKVTVGGQPVTHGSITFLSEAGKRDSYTAGIVDGQYTTDPIPCGSTKVYISSREVPPGGPVGGGSDLQATKKTAAKEKVVVVVPEKYGSPETSGLTYTVTRGSNTKDFELTP